MHKLRVIPFLLLTILVASFAQAAAPANVHEETLALLARLAESGCQFNRNGSWYGAQQAKAHLTDKLGYVEGKTRLASTEQFIELAASKSSMSGKPYLVRCGNAAPIASATWLLSELKAMRAGTGASASPPAK